MAKIKVENTEITVVSVQNEDYISLTDMAHSQMQEHIVFRWMSLKSTIEYLGEWEMLYNPNFNCTEFDTIRNAAGSNNFVLYTKRTVPFVYGIDKMLAWERLTKGKVEFTSDLVCSTITYWFGEQDMVQPIVQPIVQASGTASEQPSEQAGEQPSEQVQQLINTIRENVLTMFDIQVRLKIKSRSFVQMKLLRPAIEGGYVLRAYPDKPNHPNQRYYLSEKGLKLVK